MPLRFACLIIHLSNHQHTNTELGTRVPLIIRSPAHAHAAGRRVRSLVSLIDLAPTLLELAGILPWPSTWRTLDGHSLVPLLDNATNGGAERPVFSQYIRDLDCFQQCHVLSVKSGLGCNCTMAHCVVPALNCTVKAEAHTGPMH